MHPIETKTHPNAGTPWGDHVRRETLYKLYASVGPSGKPAVSRIAEMTGIPKQTLSGWFIKENTGKTNYLTADDKAEIELTARTQWDERKQAWHEKVGRLADKSMNRLDREIDDGEGRTIQALSISTGILIDKAGALMGDPIGQRHRVDINQQVRVEHRVIVLPEKRPVPIPVRAEVLEEEER